MKNILISEIISIKDALKKLDLCATKVLFIVDDNNRLIGSLSDGDVRRYILSNGDLNNSIQSVYNPSPFYLVDKKYTKKELEKAFIENKLSVIPIVDKDNTFVEYYLWDDILGGNNTSNFNSVNSLKDIPVVIMAGGKGTRLKPFTDVLPKPLIPIKEKPIMDWIIEEFHRFGARQFYSTLNYRGKMIEAYYDSIDKDYNIIHKWEDDFYGTAGSLKLFVNDIDETFIVTNCDIIVKANYDDVLKFHKDSGAQMTVVSSIQHHQIPYGVIEFGDKGVVSEIKEKPEYTHVINTGVYILEKKCLDLIPDNKFFHITHLMEALIKQDYKVVTYPVNEKDYIDFGQWEEYNTAVENFRF